MKNITLYSTNLQYPDRVNLIDVRSDTRTPWFRTLPMHSVELVWRTDINEEMHTEIVIALLTKQ